MLETAITSLAKALKAMSFYPPEHPRRDECLSVALDQLLLLAGNRETTLLWTRDACTLDIYPPVKSSSSTARSIAKEMLTRKLQRIILLPALSMNDLKTFLSIVTTDPSFISAKGGIESVMLEAGITTIGANEVDLSLLKGSSLEGIAEQQDAMVADSSEEEYEEEAEKPPEEAMPIEFSMLGIDILIGMLKAESRETQFLQLAREVVESAEEIKRQGALDKLIPVIKALLAIHADEQRPSTQKEFIRYALEQITNGNMTAYLLDKIEERLPENEHTVDSLCRVIGHSLAYPLIQRLCVSESLHARKTIAIALTQTGESGIPALVSMLKDERWYVVRNMVTILGEILSPDSVKALQQTVTHPEAKVRKEVVKSLVRVAPQGGENILIKMLEDTDRDVVRQVIFSLGTIRSKNAVKPLLNIATSADAFLKELELKKLAVSALGKTGDRQATEPLMDILTSRGWLAPRRWLELKIAAATALGQLGDEKALPILQRLAQRNSTLGEACNDAADNLERVVK